MKRKISIEKSIQATSSKDAANEFISFLKEEGLREEAELVFHDLSKGYSSNCYEEHIVTKTVPWRKFWSLENVSNDNWYGMYIEN